MIPENADNGISLKKFRGGHCTSCSVKPKCRAIKKEIELENGEPLHYFRCPLMMVDENGGKDG